jgi:hypothetical protein
VTKAQLKILGTLPQVIDALKALAAEAKAVHNLMQTVSPSQGEGTIRAPSRQEAPPIFRQSAPVVLRTPERDEYEQEVAERAARMAPVTVFAPKPTEELPAGQRRAIEQGFMSAIQAERQSKMGQFGGANGDDNG